VPDPDARISALACEMVRACGLDIAGADILQDAYGRLWALEVNAPYFGFDATDGSVVRGLVETIEHVATSAATARVSRPSRPRALVLGR
jgi:hypothetical protein